MTIATAELICTTCALMIANGEAADLTGWDADEFNETTGAYHVAVDYDSDEFFSHCTCFTCGADTLGTCQEATVTDR